MTRRVLACAAACCLLPLATAGAEQPSAIEQFQHLQGKLRTSRGASDWAAYRASALEQRALLNGAPLSLLEVARAEIHVGNLEAALAEVRQFARMGQAADLTAISKDFAPLSASPGYPEIRSAMAANQHAVSSGSTALVLADDRLLAEDLDYDPRSGRFFITSVREKKLIAVAADGTSRDFAAAPDGWPMVAVKVDAAHRLVWTTSVAMQGLGFAPRTDWGRSVLLGYDLESGKLRQRIDGPRSSGLGDMVLTAQGDVIVSDGDGGGVYRARFGATTLERMDAGDFISPQTPAMHPDGRHVFVPDYVRGVATLDLVTRQVRWLAMEGRFALNGIDGLYFDHGRLIAVQNGTTPERVVAFTLDPTLERIVAEKVIERATPTLGDPTHGVIVGGQLYYIANSGWSVLDDRGALKPGATLSAARIMRVQLSGL